MEQSKLLDSIGTAQMEGELQTSIDTCCLWDAGLVSTTFIGLSTYLIYVGLYSSPVTFSQDLTLRKTIRKSVMEQSKLLDSIGTAQMEGELQTSILTIAKKTSYEMKENSGIEASLSEDDIRDYMSLVIKELKRSN